MGRNFLFVWVGSNLIFYSWERAVVNREIQRVGWMPNQAKLGPPGGEVILLGACLP